jgi:hypothetical protein
MGKDPQELVKSIRNFDPTKWESISTRLIEVWPDCNLVEMKLEGDEKWGKAEEYFYQLKDFTDLK